MKKTLSLVIIGLLGLSIFSMFTPWNVKAQEIVWNTNPTPLPTPTYNHVSIIHNGRIYVIGGHNGTNPLETVYFGDIQPDGTLDTWNATTPLPEYREMATAVVWNNFVYVIGGGGPKWEGRTEQNTVYYASINPDGPIGNWNTATPLPDRIAGHGSTVWNERIYVTGGWNGYGFQNKVYFAQINPDGSLGAWNTTTNLPLYYAHMATLARNDTIYLIGGLYGPHPRTPRRSVYHTSINPDGTLGAWKSTTSLPESRAYVQAVLIDDNIYVVGGYGGNEYNVITEDTVYRATIRTNGTVGDWMELQSIPEARLLHSLMTFQGKIYVIGGKDRVDEEYIIKDTIYYSSPPTVPAPVDINPDSLNLKSKGKWITAYIELPEGYNVNDIDVSTILLNATVPAELHPVGIGDEDGDGIPDLMVKFNRTEAISYILASVNTTELSRETIMVIALAITGYLNDGTPFKGTDTMTILGRPKARGRVFLVPT